jgi:hypothetical protein
MPPRKTQQFWKSQELMELLRRRQAMFRRTAEPQLPSEGDETQPEKSLGEKKKRIIPIPSARGCCVPASRLRCGLLYRFAPQLGMQKL